LFKCIFIRDAANAFLGVELVVVTWDDGDGSGGRRGGGVHA
jgi:hypothetical protein